MYDVILCCFKYDSEQTQIGEIILDINVVISANPHFLFGGWLFFFL